MTTDNPQHGSFEGPASVANVGSYVHVYPTWGRKHDLCFECWCKPEYNSDEKLLIHNPEPGVSVKAEI